MKVVHISSMDFGGAGKAAYRLHKGLQSIGVDSRMVALYKRTNDRSVYEFPSDLACKPGRRWARLVSAWNASLADYALRPPDSEFFSLFTSPIPSVAMEKMLRDADIINLHWVAGLFSPASMPEVLKGKKIVWTLHDMNPFTGGCHYAEECTKYRDSCGACPQLGSNSDSDLSREGWLSKSAAYRGLDITVVTPSRWLGSCSSHSALFRGFRHEIIPYGFPLDIYKPVDRQHIRAALKIPAEAKVVMFCADRVRTKRKGLRYLLESMERLSKSGRSRDLILAVVGHSDATAPVVCGYPTLQFGHVDNERHMALLYNAADLFVLPSLEDNLPNTVIESLSCGTPVAAFAVGGVPDEVGQGETGWLAPAKDIHGLSEAIEWCLYRAPQTIRRACRREAEKRFPLELQANTYLALYHSFRAIGHCTSISSSNSSKAANGVCEQGADRSEDKAISFGCENSDGRMNRYLVTAVISTYNAEKFFRGCLQNLVGQTLYASGQLQIVIINSGSEQDEESIARDFMGRYEHIVYRRTQRETLYAAWNRGIELAAGQYITHANTDDRHCANAFERMAHALGRNDVGLVYVDALMTRGANETFAQHSAKKAWRLPDFNIRQALLDCPFGCQVMWKSSAHAEVGMFDSTYKRAGDYEFFLRLGIKAGALHLPQVLALYHESPSNLSYESPREVIQEVNRFIGLYRRQLPLEFIYPYLQEDRSPVARAAALVDFANNLMGRSGFLFKDSPLAEKLYRQALVVLPGDPDIIGNLVIACLVNGLRMDAMSLLQSAPRLTPRLAYYRDALMNARTPPLTLTGMDHPGLCAMPAIKSAHDIRVPWTSSVFDFR